VLVANDGSIYSGFVVPHNEYIRFYYDGGLLGAACLFIALAVTFGMVYRKVETAVRSYYAMFLLGFIIYTFTDNTLSTVQFIVPFCVYLCALINHSAGAEGGEERHGENRVVRHPLRQL